MHVFLFEKYITSLVYALRINIFHLRDIFPLSEYKRYSRLPAMFNVSPHIHSVILLNGCYVRMKEIAIPVFETEPKFHGRTGRNRIIEIGWGRGNSEKIQMRDERLSNRKREREIYPSRPYRRWSWSPAGRFVRDKPRPFAISNLVVDGV